MTQGGVPYRFYFQLGPDQPEFVTAMSSAEAGFIAPDNLFASARITVRGILVNVGLFATGEGQWLSPLNAAWIPYVYAEGFDPGDMMEEGNGFNRAISGLTELTYIGTEMREGTEVVHVRGNATGEVVNTLLFGILEIVEDNTVVDVYIDEEALLPVELLLTLPDSADEEYDDTFWSINIYDANEVFEVDSPEEVNAVVPPVEEIPITETNPWILPLLWVMGISSIAGAVITPFVYQRKKRSISNAVVIGGLAGATGSLAVA